MSYFAGGGWRNVSSPLAQATITTNNVSVSRQGSVDESVPGGLAERKPLLRAQTDPLNQLAAQNSSQTSLTPANVDAAAAGRRFTFRGVARALPYFLRSIPATTTVSVAQEEAERNAVSASPPSQSVADLHAKVSPKESTLPEDTPASAEDGTEDSSSAGHEEKSESVVAEEQEGTASRKSTSSSNGSTVVTEEPQTMSQGLEDELSEMKRRLSVATEHYTTLQQRINGLEKESEQKTSQMKLAEEASLAEKADYIRVHEAELETHRRRVLELQQSLEASQRQSKEVEAKLGASARQRDALQQEISTQDGLLRDSQRQVEDLTAAKEKLRETIRKLQETVEEKDEVTEELHGQNLALEETRQLLEREVIEMEEEMVQNKEANQKALDQMAEEHRQQLTEATSTIQSLREELSSHSVTIDQLRASLDAAHANTETVSKVADERAGALSRAQHLLSGLQDANQALERKVADQESQMRAMKETSDKEWDDLCATHAVEMDTQHHMVQNLQSSLQAIQHDLSVKEEKLSVMLQENGDLRDHVAKLEDQCRAGEERSNGLEDSLVKANVAIQDLEEKTKVLREGARKEKAAFVSQRDRLRQQLEDAQKSLVERDERIQRLEATKNDLGNALRRVQTTVNEKELMVQSLQTRYATLEEAKTTLEEQIIETEKTLVEVRDTAQGVLERTVEGHQHEMTQAKSRIQELQDELSSFITTAQQLQSSLEASHADTEKAETVAEDRKADISVLQERVTALQESVRAQEAKTAETLSRIKSMDQAAREEKAEMLRSHATEMETQRRRAHGLQETLERGVKESEEKLRALAGENSDLREEVAAMKERSRKSEEDVNVAHATLREVTERNKTSFERLEDEKVRLDEEVEQLRRYTDELQRELKDRGEEVEKLKETALQKMSTVMSNALGGLWHLLGVSSSAASRSG